MRQHPVRPTLLFLALAVSLAPVAKADNIDLELIKKAPEILKFLKDKDYKNVGVLHFQLQKGKGRPTYNGGPINTNMSTRLENALLMEIDPKSPVGIIRDASTVAASRAPASPGTRAVPRTAKACSITSTLWPGVSRR